MRVLGSSEFLYVSKISRLGVFWMNSDGNPADRAITSWRVTGFALVTISVGFYLYVQGSHVSPSTFISDNTSKYAACVYALLVLLPLSAYFYAYTFHVAKFLIKNGSALTFPLLHELHLPRESDFVKKVILFSLIILFLVPLLSLVHFYKKSLDSPVYLNESCVGNRCPEVWSNSAQESLTKFSGFWEIFTDGNKYSLDGQITYFPGWQPWFEFLLLTLVLLLWARALYEIIRYLKVKPGD